ncbi:MAG: Ig-like domain-containing protein [Smithella sp.]
MPITLAWGAVPDADGGYKFYLKPVAADTLTEIGTSAAGTTTVTIPLALPDGKYTVHAVACDVAGNQSDLSLPATLNDTGTVVYLMKPGKATVKIKTVH